ncbi:MAG: phytoene synthase [bacterium]|nr:MAG: phytoene synthase [bacterium]KAF0148048.1 MAG: phytoene synthase [bacterium]KAF0167564.1 MAG: phytoene synthase [bacterium]TXT17493.1 MAG: phytoene synthase [bacterium]
MDPHTYCQEKAAASGSSFYYSFRFLPPERRRAITAFYAFCREVDDVADECRDADLARAKLAWWRDEVARLYAGRPEHPATRALAEAIGPFHLPEDAFGQIIDGMEMDLGTVRYADFKQLNLYCHRAAGVVGEVAALIFGSTVDKPIDRATLKYANRLGLAFQLTNIIRDVGEDARRNRIYLPQDELAKHGVTEADVLAGRMTENFRRLMEFQYQRATRTYAEALALLPEADRKAQRPGLVMAAIYRALLEEIRADGFRVLDRRTSLTPLRKLWIAWRTWVTA